MSSFFNNHDVTFIDGVRDNPTHRGIAQAHINAITHAQAERWDKVLIMEDDVRFQSILSRSYADRAMSNLPQDWDILLSSVYLSRGLTRINEYWSETKEFCGLTFYIVHERAYQRIIGFDKSIQIDRAMTKLGLRCFVANEFFAIQYEGYSDNAKKVVNYSNLLSKFKLLPSEKKRKTQS